MIVGEMVYHVPVHGVLVTALVTNVTVYGVGKPPWSTNKINGIALNFFIVRRYRKKA